MKILQIPTPQLVHTYMKRFETEQSVVETALAKLFTTFPKNTSLDEVLLKVVVLNRLYVTNIYAIGAVAERIHRHNIDSELEQERLDLVETIASVEIKGKSYRFYSFATKYCAWHLPEAYPIYDSFVENILWEYQKQYKFSGYKRYDPQYSYKSFVKVLSDFQDFFGLNQFTLKQMDTFLWLYSKEYAAR